MDKKVFDYKKRWQISSEPKGVETATKFQDFGTERINPDRYISKDFMDAEWNKIWTKTWLMACSSTDIKEVGDYFNFKIGKESIIVMRSSEDSVHAFYNVCPHRGNRLFFDDFGFVKDIGCRFHGWKFNLDGTNQQVTDSEVDVFDREEVFIDRELLPIAQRFPKLKIVLEHITTSYAVDFVQENNIGATITPHHLHINRNAMFFGGLNSDFYCLPVAKRENNRLALRKAATSGKKCFFLGTDSAPHLRKWKAFCGCAGIFNSPVAIESYLTVFEEEDALDNFEKFASLNGPNFYNLPPNKEKLKLVSRPNKIKEYIDVVEEKNIVGQIKPFHAGETLQWHVEGIVN